MNALLLGSKGFSRFIAACSLDWMGNSYIFDCVFDTGCSYTYVPVNLLGISSKTKTKEAKKRVIKDYNNGSINLSWSVGVESGNVKLPDIRYMTNEELFLDSRICFI